MRLDMRLDMRVDMRTDMHTDMHIDMHWPCATHRWKALAEVVSLSTGASIPAQ